MDNKKLVDWKIKELNKYLLPCYQGLRLVEMRDDNNEIYYDLKWDRNYPSGEIEEHVFGGDVWEINVVLTGIECGIRMQQYKL